jgi:hypothetical protein
MQLLVIFQYEDAVQQGRLYFFPLLVATKPTNGVQQRQASCLSLYGTIALTTLEKRFWLETFPALDVCTMCGFGPLWR